MNPENSNDPDLEIIQEPKLKHPIGKTTLFLGVMIILATFLASFWVGHYLSDDHKYPIHWGLNGKPNGYAGKEFVLYFIPCDMLFILLILTLVPVIEPMRKNLRASGPAYRVYGLCLLLLFAYTQGMVLKSALGHPINANSYLMPALGVFFMVIDNYFGKISRNFIFGVRTPWTLTSELSWNKTHRLAGRMFVILGAVLILIALNPAWLRFTGAVLIGGIVTATLIPASYSYLVWKQDKKSGSTVISGE
jgi:uncharacterized membrane protein